MRGRALSDHHVDLAYSEEDGGYIADIPDLEACSAFGASPEEALAEVKKAKEAWLAAAVRQAVTTSPWSYALRAGHTSTPNGDSRGSANEREGRCRSIYRGSATRRRLGPG